MSAGLKFHPLADIFPLMEGAEFDELVADIKAHGLREKIDLYKGQIIEGRNRYLALRRLGIDPSADPSKYFRKAIYAHTVGGEIASHEQSNDDRARAYVISKNIHRRHLNAEQKRDLIAKLLKAQPDKSNNAVAKQAKVDDKTVAKVRRGMEARSEIPNVENRTDTKGRKQPAKRTTYVNADSGPPKRISKAEGLALKQKGLNDIASKLIEYDSDLAFNLVLILRNGAAAVERLANVIASQLVALGLLGDSCLMAMRAEEAAPAENAPSPDVSADAMKAKIAALDDGADRGPMPESLPRAP
jgi:hypothetical protein